MGLLDILSKLGILRYGATSATYTNAKDRPSELQMDGVLNAERDLTNLQDLKKVKAVMTGTKKD